MRCWVKLGMAALGALAVASAPAGAATVTFDFANGSVPSGGGGTNSGSGYSNVRSYSNGGITLTVTGFSLTTSTANFAAANVGQYSGGGLGVCNAAEGLSCSSPSHQVDNSSGYDFLLLKFSPAVTITGVTVNSTSSNDTDVSFFTGNTGSSFTVLGSSIAQLAGLGLTQGNDAGSPSTNSFSIAGGPYNTLLIGAALSGDSYSDYWKLKTITLECTNGTGQPNEVPEPLSTALFGTGLIGLGLVVRRRRGQG